MATCLGIRTEKIRARVVLSTFSVSTPHIKAFNIDETRGQLSKTFSCTLEVPVSASYVPGTDLEIHASVGGVEKQKFTGVIKSIQVQPSFDKAGYYILNISGTDKLGDLEGKTFSRRLRSDGFSLFVSIDSGPSNRPSRGLSIDKRVRGGKHTYTSPTPNPNKADHTKLTYMPKRGSSKYGEFGKIGEIGPNDNGSGSGGKVHDHSSMENLGPAWGTYISD